MAGGFSAVACMANTQPVNDDPAMTDYILDRAQQDSPARVYPVAAATRGLKGEKMTEMSALKEAGAVADGDGLRAYYVADPDPGARRLRAHCAGLLPAYMVPSALTRLDALPRTSTGKVALSELS